MSHIIVLRLKGEDIYKVIHSKYGNSIDDDLHSVNGQSGPFWAEKMLDYEIVVGGCMVNLESTITFIEFVLCENSEKLRNGWVKDSQLPYRIALSLETVAKCAGGELRENVGNA